MCDLSRSVKWCLCVSISAIAISTMMIGQSLSADPDKGPANLDLEGGTLGQVPTGWFVPGACSEAGYTARLSEDHPKQGNRCALLSRDAANRTGMPFGNLMQSFDATPYRGCRVRFRAKVRVEGAQLGNRGQLWLRVDRAGRQPGFFDNMADRPITDASWRDYEIVGDVADDAEGIALGLMMFGNGRVWLDAASFEIVGKRGDDDEPSRPLEGRGLENLVAFTRLLGYVRYFHPSDQAAATNWEQFAIEGVRAVEGAKDPDALARVLERLFLPIAPSVRIFVIGKAPAGVSKGATEPAPPAEKGANSPKVLAWRHIGVGLGRSPVYTSKRVDPRAPQPLIGQKLPELARPDSSKPYAADLGGGVSCLIPLALTTNEKGTLPQPDLGVQARSAQRSAPRPAGFHPSGKDRSTRLGVVALAWNVFQHFYPYFDVVEVDWDAELRRALTEAAEDRDELAFAQTLRRLVAALHDGHGGV